MNTEFKLTIIAGPVGDHRNKMLSGVLEHLGVTAESTTTVHGHNLSRAGLYSTLWGIEDSGDNPACLVINDLDFSDTGLRYYIAAASDPTAPFLQWQKNIDSLTKYLGRSVPSSFTYSQHIIIVTSYDLSSRIKGTSNRAEDIRIFISRANFVNLFTVVQEDISNLYKNVFSSNDGMLVLKDLERIVNQTKIDAQNINPNTAVWKCAQESLLKRIKNQLI